MNILKKLSFAFIIASLVCINPINSMVKKETNTKTENTIKKAGLVTKLIGGAKVTGGAAIGIPNTLRTAAMLNNHFAGCKSAEVLATTASALAHPGILVHGGAAVAGAIALISGVEKIFSKDEQKIEDGKVLILYKGKHGREYSQRYGGSDVANFLGHNGFFVNWRDGYEI